MNQICVKDNVFKKYGIDFFQQQTAWQLRKLSVELIKKNFDMMVW